MSSGKFSIDETFINVHLKGGNLHTELLHIEGSFIKGQFKGQSVPLKCNWFNMTKDNDFVEIEDVTGQFYQPCILDIDTKIMVQAIPILDFDYNGMPLMAETNYLQADSKIFDLVNQAFNDGKMQINCKLENLQENQSDLSLPLVCSLIINEEGLQLKTDSNKIICQYQKYEMKIVKKNNNQIEVFGESSKFLAALTNNLVRDALYQFGKTLKGKKVHQNDMAHIFATITDQEQKIKQLEQEIIQNQEQKTKNKQTIQDQSNQINQLTKKVEQLEKQQMNHQVINQNREKELNNLKQNLEKLDGKNQIYIQEIKVLKSQAIALENLNKKYIQEIDELKKNQQQNQDEIREMFYREKLESMKQQIDKCTKENQQWQLINDQLMKEIKKLENQNLILQEEKEKLQNELNSLKRKYESLLKESELNKKKDRSDISSENEVNSNKQSEILIANTQFQQQEEINRLKATINNLEITIKNLKHDYEQEMLKFTNKHFLKSNTPQEIQALQRLANSLAESLNDKEQALQTQRNINRELLSKIQELSK